MLVSWNTTRKCNLQCHHCYRDSGPGVGTGAELTTQEGKRLLDQLQTAGFYLVVLSGGEPLLRSDIFDFIQYTRILGMRPVLGTNGTLLTKETAQKLRESGLAGVGISLDSTEPERHDDVRGQSGVHEETVTGVRNAVHAGLRVQINMTLTERNYQNVEEMVELAEGLGVHALYPFFLVPTGRGEKMEMNLLSEKHYFQVLDSVLQKQQESVLELKPTCAPQFLPLARQRGVSMRFTRGCLAGVSYCCILPEGDVHPCPYLPLKAGNVRQTPFQTLWRSSDIFERLRQYSNYKGRCGGCHWLDLCGGCRARAYYNTDGDYLGEDPYAQRCVRSCAGKES